jgi:hypothetical protein
MSTRFVSAMCHFHSDLANCKESTLHDLCGHKQAILLWEFELSGDVPNMSYVVSMF